jgi:hypothetical protein
MPMTPRRSPDVTSRMAAGLRTLLRRSWHGQDGNGLVLMPAGVLILFFLASLAADTSMRWRAQASLEAEATGLANDAVAAIDPIDWFTAGATVPTHATVGTILDRSDRCTGTLVPGSTPAEVTVTCTDIHHWLFRPGTFTATSTARAQLRDS